MRISILAATLIAFASLSSTAFAVDEAAAKAYAKQLETATGENRRALDALLDQSLAEIAAIRAKQAQQIAPSPNHEPGSIISVQTRNN